MPVQIKKQVAPTTKDSLSQGKAVLTADEKALVDRMAEINKKVEEVKPLLKEFEEIKKTLASVAADESRFPPTAKAILRGNTGVVEFSERGTARFIKDMNGAIGVLRQKLGFEGMIELIKLNLGDLDKYLTKEEQVPYIGTGPGSRSCKSVRMKDD